MKKSTALAVSLLLLLTTLTGCASGGDSPSVYYLNFKPEQDGQWQELAKVYTQETGIQVKVLTAASGAYESTLKSEIAKSDAPTLFQVNGPVGLQSWKNYCYDLSDSAVVEHLTADEFALKNGEEIAGVAYVIESYGLIYNKNLLAQAGYTQEDINSFVDLKEVAEDITYRQEELGFAAFTSAGMDGSSNWRFQSHLANLPLYYEYQADGITSSPAIQGYYLQEYRNIWDLYINNSTTSPALLSARTGEDAVAEFVTERAVFYQNGTWAYQDIASLGDENLGMLPIYIGVAGEENQGLCTGTENYWCVNSKASQEDIDATLDFMEWVVTSDVGVNTLCGDMGFVIPFDTNLASENPLVNIANDYVEAGRTPVSWNFPTMPSDAWRNNLGSALTAYAAGTAGWSDVESAFVEGWATEYQASNP